MESKTEGIRACDLAADYKDQKFKLAKGRVIWESVCWRKDKVYISRVVTTVGKPFLLGLNYIGRYIEPDTILYPVDVCPMCFDPDCTSDHK
jgi:hypothetical protein